MHLALGECSTFPYYNRGDIWAKRAHTTLVPSNTGQPPFFSAAFLIIETTRPRTDDCWTETPPSASKTLAPTTLPQPAEFDDKITGAHACAKMVSATPSGVLVASATWLA
jgi:hypothetical protein